MKIYDSEIIIHEEYSVEEQIKFFHSADIVFMPHGAASTNVLYMREGTVFIEAFSSKYIEPYMLFVIKLLNLNYYMMVQRGSQGGKLPNRKTWNYIESNSADMLICLEYLDIILSFVTKRY